MPVPSFMDCEWLALSIAALWTPAAVSPELEPGSSEPSLLHRHLASYSALPRQQMTEARRAVQLAWSVAGEESYLASYRNRLSPRSAQSARLPRSRALHPAQEPRPRSPGFGEVQTRRTRRYLLGRIVSQRVSSLVH